MQITFGQLSLSASTIRRTDNWSLVDHFNFKSYSNPFVLQTWGMNLCYVNEGSFVQFGASYFCKKSISANRSYGTSTGGGSNPSYIYERAYYANFGFKNLGVRLEGGGCFKGRSLFTRRLEAELLLSLFIQSDFKFDEVETDHIQHFIEGNNNNMNHEYVETSNVWYEDEYDAVLIKNIFVSVGVNVKRRLIFKDVFFELNASLGVGVGDRLRLIAASDSQDFPFTFNESFTASRKGLNPFFDTGISVGYIFQKKSRTNSPT